MLKTKTRWNYCGFIPFCLLIFIAGCGGGGGENTVVPPPPVTVDGVQLTEHTKILDSSAMQKITVSADASTLTAPSGTSSIENVSTGSVLVNTDGQGLARKVTSIEKTDTQVIVHTEQAKLEDVVQKGILETEKPLSTNDITQEEPLVAGVSRNKKAAAGDGEFYINMSDVVLYDKDGNPDTTNDQIVANGSVKVKPEIIFHAEVDGFPPELKSLKFVLKADENAELTVKSRVNFLDINKEIEIWRAYLTPIPLGPVVLEPVLTVVVGINANAGAEIQVGVTQTASFSAGVLYENKQWSPVQELSKDFGFNAPSLSVDADLKGYAGAKMNLLLWGVVGPYVGIDGYLQLVANVFDDPWWKLYGGLEGKGGVKIDIFGFLTVGYEATLIDYKVLLAQAPQNQNPVISSLSASPSSVVTGVKSTLTCSASDPDGDTLTYSWTGGGGTISGSGSSVTWTAPSTDGTYTPKCEVSDGKGGTASKTVSVTVIKNEGSATVTW